MVRRAHALWLYALICGLSLVPSTVTAQTSTFHLHKETIVAGTYRLVTDAPDASSFVIQSPDLFGLPLSGEYVFAQFGTPAWVPGFTGTIPSGSTVTFSVWMNKTSTASKVYPRAKLSKWDGGTQKTPVCASNSRSNLTTTLVKYVFTCTTGSTVTFAVTDRLLLEVGGNFSTSPGQHSLILQLYVEGALNGNYDSSVTVPLSSNPAPATLGVPRSAATASRAGTGRVLVVGGANPQVLDTAEEFDPATRMSTVLPSPLTAGRARHAETALPDGMVLFTGGLGAGGILGSSDLLDPVTQTFGSGPSLVSPRSGHTATVLIDGGALILGGESPGGGSTEDELFNASRYLVGASVYDSTAGQFDVIGSVLQVRRWNHTATTLADGRILITGGRSSAGVLGSAEIFDPSLGTSRLLASTLTTVREGHTATLLPNGSVTLVGGSNGSEYLSTVELFDPASETFSPAAVQLSVARAEHVAMLLSGGVLMVGGGEATTGILEHVEFLQVLPGDPVTPTVSAIFPASGAQDQPLTTVIGIRFSESVDPSTLASITFTAGGTAVPMHVAAGESGLYAFLVAEQPLEPETEYTIQIQGVRDLSGNLLPSTVTSTFTTGAAPDTALAVGHFNESHQWRHRRAAWCHARGSVR